MKKQVNKKVLFASAPLPKVKYTATKFPFEDKSHEQIVEQLHKIGLQYQQKFTESLQRLDQFILSVNPELALSFFSMYSLMTIANGKLDLHPDNSLIQPHVELLQALFLKYHRHELPEIPTPHAFKELETLLKLVTEAFHMKRMAQIDSSIPQSKLLRMRAIESMRSQTQTVRNWGYPQQIIRVVSELFAPLDSMLEARKGVRIGALVTMCSKLITIIEDKTSNHLNRLSPIFKANTINSAVDGYYEAFNLKDSSQKMKKYLKSKNISLEQARVIMITHSELFLPEIFTFRLDDLVAAYPDEIIPDTLEQIIAKWTFSFGDLKNCESEHLFMGNPVWDRPFILLQGDRYFCPIPTLLNTYLLEMMTSLIQEDEDLKKAYEASRSKYLEEQTHLLFKTALPSAKIYRGSQWCDATCKKTFENDLIVAIDNQIILIENKSGQVTPPARRGAEDRLKKTVKELLEEPSRQSKRFADYLLNNRTTHWFTTKHGNLNEVDTSQIRSITRLNITLDLFCLLNMRWQDLQEAGFLADDLEAVPTISLADLEIVVEILHGPAQTLHYFMKRTEIENQMSYIGDEADLLAFYLDTAFCVPKEDLQTMLFNIAGMSQHLDPYFMQNWSHSKPRKPTIRLTKLWKNLLQKVEERQKQNWTEIAVALLNTNYTSQKRFETEFKRVQETVKLFHGKSQHNNAYAIYNDSCGQKDAIVGLAVKAANESTRNNLMREVTECTWAHKPARVVVICADVESSGYPYDAMGLAFAKDQHCISKPEAVSNQNE